MGRSAKFMKRPTKAEKVSRKVTAPVTSARPANRVRSLSPEDPNGTEYRSPIPLFNTSAKNRGNGRQLEKHRQQQRQQDHNIEMDDDQQPAQTEDAHTPAFDTTFPATSSRTSGTTKTMSLKHKMKQAKEQMRIEEDKRKAKLAGGALAGRRKSSGLGGAGASTKDKFRLGTDYVALHESRPGGAFKKKLR
ncbi:hypothetical protein ACM66B_006732 [Microbotryomycetes sp. NB124-2]